MERRRKNRLPNIDRSLKYLKSKIEKGIDYNFEATAKSSNGLYNGISNRRSRYLGVSKNNLRFQTLINIRNRKQYIRTYCDEIEAAIAYDFYAIALKKIRATTNFSYDNDMLVNMIDAYFKNDKVLDPKRFANKVFHL